jgi:hypothetical protein
MEYCYTNSNSLFKRYSKLLTWFSRTQLGRDYLGISNDHKDIALLLPNGYHRKDEKTYQGIIYSGNKFEKKLYPALATIEKYRIWFDSIEQIKEAFLFGLNLRGLGLLPKEALLLKFNQSTFYPNASAVSGGVGRGAVNETWATIRSGAGNETEVTASVTHALLSSGTTNQWQYLRRVITQFDTSSLTSSATITGGSNTWGLYISSVTDLYSQTIRMVESTPASATSLANSDYAQVGTTAQSATEKTLASMTVSAYNNLTLNTTGDGNISKTGITKFGARYLSDINNAQPTWQNTVNGNYVWQSEAGANPAKLVVNFTLPDTSVRKLGSLNMMGIGN